MTIVIRQVGPDVGFFVEEMGDQPLGFVRDITLTLSDLRDPMEFLRRNEGRFESADVLDENNS